MSRNTPSQLLREALLEYSRKRKRSRSRRDQGPEISAHVDPIPIENVFPDVAHTDKDDVEMAMASGVTEDEKTQQG